MDEKEENNVLDGIAVIGMAVRFPEADSITQFWDNLINKKDCINTLSIDEVRAKGVPESIINKSNYVRRGGRIRNVDQFDASFFGFSPKEAKLLDPQQRLFLKCGWEAIEHAGYDVSRLHYPVGVFGGCSFNYYLLNNLISNPDILSQYSELQTLFNSDKDFLATRLSYKFNLKGPSFTVQAACSTSLVAVHVACQNLLTYHCDMALAGGVSLAIPWWNGYLVGDVDIRSPDGVCRPFDRAANGTLFGEGAGVVVLKRLEDAVSDGDTIYAVIKGTAINNDGAIKAGYTTPSADGQVEVITAAIETAGIDCSEISYIETHGTGTPLGDPVEVNALTKAFRQYTKNKQYCGIGSVKASIGHLDSAAGVAGLIKTVLALHHKTLPASLNFTEANPLCEFDDSPFYVVTETKPWTVKNGGKRIAGVSSLGVGGTNVHVILEEALIPEKNRSSSSWQVLPVSAKTLTSLNKLSESYSEYLKNETKSSLADIAFTMQQGRQHFPYRHFVVTDSHVSGSQDFSSISQSDSIHLTDADLNKVVFMFSGQGAQYSNMGKDLYKCNKVFRNTFDICANHLLKLMSLDIRDLLFSENPDNAIRLQQTDITQPLLVSFEIALAKVWKELGITPAAVIGHSIGEYSAACIAGVFTIEDVLSIVVERGRIMAAQPPGKMLSVSLPADKLQPMLPSGLEISLVNSSSLSVVSGNDTAIGLFQAELEKNSIACREIHTSHAFHSALMDGAVEPFNEVIKKYRPKTLEIPLISNSTGTWIDPSQVWDPNYWGRHIRNKVDFAGGLRQLLNDGYGVFIEIGPGNTLSTFLNSTFNDAGMPWKRSGKKIVTSTSIRHPKSPVDDWAHLLTSFAILWKHGIEIDWKKLHSGEKRFRVPLPTYQFDDKRFWIEPTIRLNYGAGIPCEEVPSIQCSNSLSGVELDDNGDPLQKDASHSLDETSEDVIKTELVTIWKTVLGIDKIDYTTSFFDLGGDSMSAVQMFSKIQKRIGVNLQLATLFAAPSINELSSKITKLLPKTLDIPKHTSSVDVKRQKPLSFVVKMKASGTRIPFFCIHGVGGNVIHYKKFLPYLDKNQPFYGIQCRGLDGIEKPFESVNIMAKSYINEILQIQPHGPYLLGGGSMGGLVAFEIAQQLKEMGESIGLILMMDSVCPQVIKKPTSPGIQKHSVRLNKKRPLVRRLIHSVSCRIEDYKKLTLCELFRRQGKPIPHELRYWQIEQKNLAIANAYIPKPYDGKVSLFRALKNTENTDPYRGWKDFVKRGIELYDFECEHKNMIENIYVEKKLSEILQSLNFEQ